MHYPRVHYGRALGALPLLALVTLLAGACGDARPLRVAVVVGDAGEPGARAAAEDINAAGGIDGHPLELLILPGMSFDADSAIRTAERLAADGTVLAVVGHGNSSASLAASQVYNAHGLVQVAPTSTASLLSTAGPYTFRVVPGDARQAAFLAAQAARWPAARTAAIVYHNDDYGRGLHRDLSRELVARGVQVVASVPYLPTPGDGNLAHVPAHLAMRRPQVVFWMGRTDGLEQFLARARELLPGVPVLGSDGVDARPVYENPAAYAGLHFVRFVDPDATRACVARFRGRPGAPAGGVSEMVLNYDAVVLLAEALRARPRTRAALRRRLAAVGTTAPAVAGCAGPIRFDSSGDVERPYLLARVDSRGVAPAGVRP